MDKTIRIWDTERGKQIGAALKGHTGTVRSVAISRDGKKIVSGSDDKTIIIWDTETGKQIGKPLEGHTGGVTSVAISQDGKKIASGSFDNTIRIWDAETCEQIGEPLEGHTERVYSVVFFDNDKKVVSGNEDGTIRIWDLKEKNCTVMYALIDAEIEGCNFKNARFHGKDEKKFYHILYSGGGIVPEEYIPKTPDVEE